MASSVETVELTASGQTAFLAYERTLDTLTLIHTEATERGACVYSGSEADGVDTRVGKLGDHAEATTMKGTITRLIADKGFGFIKGEDGLDYFMHRSAVQGGQFEELQPGHAVTFEPSRGDKGPRAENVRV